ncbi:MAG: hypothetical protein WBE41_12750 [Terracidiphilus sp.]
MKRLIIITCLLTLIMWGRNATSEAAKEGLDLKLGPEWQVANHANAGWNTILEYVRAGDDINRWKELVTIQKFIGTKQSSPEQELNLLKALREKECPGITEWNVIEKDESSILYEWHAKSCQSWPEQHEIARILLGNKVKYFLRYTVKAFEMTQEARTQWIQTFSSASISANPKVDPLDPNAKSSDVDESTPFAIDKVMAALKPAMESVNCNVKESYADRVECKRPRVDTDWRYHDVGGESVTAVLDAQGDQTRVRITTGKGIYGRLGKDDWSMPIYQEMMKRLQEAQPTPANTLSQGAVPSPAQPIPARQLAQELSANWGKNPTANARLELKEMGRKMARSHTEVTYSLETALFPQGNTYALWEMESGDQKIFPLMGGFSADATGALICPAVPQPGNFAPIGTPCMPARTLEQSVVLTFSTIHKGEPLDFAVVSADGTVRAYAHTYPFPITAQDGKCTLVVELEDTKITSFVIRATGFDPGEVVKSSSSFGNDATVGTQEASSQGEFVAALRADLPGKSSGSATFAATGNSCHPTVNFDWGKAALKAVQ